MSDRRLGGASSREEAPRERVVVSPAVVPLLLGCVVIGFFAGYILAWKGAVVVGIVLLVAGVLALRGRGTREPAAAAALGVLVGYALVIALALFRGVI